MKVTGEQFANKLVELFPEKKQALTQHYEDYGELLGHIFFDDEIGLPLFDLMQKNDAGSKVSAYCRFIEEMWRNGTDDVGRGKTGLINGTFLDFLRLYKC